MPKASRVVFAKNESTGKSLWERIDISDPHRFDHVGKPRRVIRPRTTPYTPVPGRREELARQAARNAFKTQLEREDYTNEQRKRKLADRLTTPPPPLTDRISSPEPLVLDIKPFPSDLHFHKNVQVNQLRDYKRKFGATATRLTPFFELLDKARASIDPQVATQLWVLGQRFNRLYDNLTTLVEKKAISNREWKDISRDLTTVGKHSFKALKPRFVEHCQELVTELGPDWLKIAEEIEVVLV